MRKIVIAFEVGFTRAQEKLRCSGWGEEGKYTSSVDPYDEASYHVTAKVDDEVVGMIRITDGPPFLINEWAQAPCPLPTTPNVVSLTRAVVSDQWRNYSLYKTMMLATMLDLAAKKTPRIAVGAVEPDFPLKPFLFSIGFETVGEPLGFIDPPHEPRLGECVRIAPAKHREVLVRTRQQLEAALETKGLPVIFPDYK